MYASILRRARRAALALGAGVAGLLPLSAASAAGFPDRPITLVVAFSPGGSNDITARAISQPLAKMLGVPVVVENRPGAAGMIGAGHVARAEPDGYTLFVSSASPLVILPHTQKHVPYDARKDFADISLIGITPEVLAVHPGVPAHDLKELVALAKTRSVTLASSGTGGLPHLAIELLKKAAPEARFVHVPYKGAAPAVSDTLAGHVDGVVVDLPAVYPHVVADKLRGIALAGETRSAFMPKLPTSVEQGYPGFVAANWIALLAPAKTPQPVVDKLHGALLEVMKQPQVGKILAKAGVEVSISPTTADFRKFLDAEYGKWGQVVKDAGIEPTN
ncbi:Bug family tripartite tricarboxylate transporter substrate binding protein [Candidimonas nitroreducens]|uniref:ABC transporter substrate-binding protein n=1 Tax=Candidimonas nitroreducens TaxID=683354 RepID=A0A225M0K3_9BURK|nr:tripartite tricarboxylate transporter substrate binding protein [Candidimonas nitroreducens]OWT53743.1 hypothetical protein CEY11_23775 [Candidimonas nitroreducens]